MAPTVFWRLRWLNIIIFSLLGILALMLYFQPHAPAAHSASQGGGTTAPPTPRANTTVAPPTLVAATPGTWLCPAVEWTDGYPDVPATDLAGCTTAVDVGGFVGSVVAADARLPVEWVATATPVEAHMWRGVVPVVTRPADTGVHIVVRVVHMLLTAPSAVAGTFACNNGASAGPPRPSVVWPPAAVLIEVDVLNTTAAVNRAAMLLYSNLTLADARRVADNWQAPPTTGVDLAFQVLDPATTLLYGSPCVALDHFGGSGIQSVLHARYYWHIAATNITEHIWPLHQ